ncbi:HAD family hydrolase [Haliangium sp.]|uniref:HAD family hydrolase n=1 Tax=Haliangium sp. TaxID=2663208 RepID=UPI003D0B6953
MLYLFDIDGTLLLSGGAGSAALDAVFAERYGIDGAMDAVSPGGKTDPVILTEIFESRLGRRPTEAEIEAVLVAYVPHLIAAVTRSTGYRLMPAVHETLDFLGDQDGVVLALATGNIRRAAQAKLDRAGLWERFAVGGFGDDSADRAVLVQHAIERGRRHAGVAYSEAEIVVVGDTVRDIEAARACGVRVVAVATGSVPAEALAAEAPDAVFETLAELPAWHRAQR